MKISVIIPCFNEENSIIEILNKVNLQKKKFDLEIIVSDDGSKDGTIKKLEENSDYLIIYYKVNTIKERVLQLSGL